MHSATSASADRQFSLATVFVIATAVPFAVGFIAAIRLTTDYAVDPVINPGAARNLAIQLGMPANFAATYISWTILKFPAWLICGVFAAILGLCNATRLTLAIFVAAVLLTDLTMDYFYGIPHRVNLRLLSLLGAVIFIGAFSLGKTTAQRLKLRTLRFRKHTTARWAAYALMLFISLYGLRMLDTERRQALEYRKTLPTVFSETTHNMKCTGSRISRAGSLRSFTTTPGQVNASVLPPMRLQFSTKTLLALLTLAAVTLAYYTYTPKEILFEDLKINGPNAAAINDTADLPDSIARLHNRRVRVRGFIHGSSVSRQTGIEQFVLVRDNQMCSPGPQIDDWIVVTMTDGKTIDFSVRPVTVTGKLFVTARHKKPDGTLAAIYEMKARDVSDGYR